MHPEYDLHSFSVDRFRLQERCPQIVGFVETDAFTDRGIDALKQLLQTTVKGMEDIWVPLERSDLLADHALERRLKAIHCATHGVEPILKMEHPALGWMQVEESIRKAVEKRRQVRP